MFKDFDFFGFEWKFSFYKRLLLKWTLTWKNISKKKANFSISDHFLATFLPGYMHHNHVFFLLLDSPKIGEHFSYPHDASSTPRSKAKSTWKIKISRKKNFVFKFFPIFFQKIKNFNFFSFFSHVFLFVKTEFVVKLRRWPGY